MKINIGSKILFSFLLIISLLTVLSIYNFNRMSYIEEGSRTILTEAMDSAIQIKNIQAECLEQDNALRGYIITGQQEFLDNFQMAKAERMKISELNMQLIYSEEENVLFNKLIGLLDEYDRIAEKTISLKKQELNEDAIKDMKYKAYPKTQELKLTVAAILSEKELQINERLEDHKNIQAQTKSMIYILMITAVVFSIALILLITINITKPIRQFTIAAQEVAHGNLNKEVKVRTKDEIKHLADAFNSMIMGLRSLIIQSVKSAEEVAAASQQLSASSQQVSCAVEEVSSTTMELSERMDSQLETIKQSKDRIQQIFVHMDRISDTVEKVLKLSETGQASTEKGINVSRQASGKIKQLQMTTKETSERIMKLDKESEQIVGIVDLIRSLYDGINLLALNAAIEAARAGEAGRGFAVVAEEIRKMADQSSSSAYEISKLIFSIQEQIKFVSNLMASNGEEMENSVQAVDKASSNFDVIHQEMEVIVQEIQLAMQAVQQVVQEAAGIMEDFEAVVTVSQETAKSAQEVSTNTQEQTAQMEEIAQTAATLAAIAEALSNNVTLFKV